MARRDFSATIGLCASLVVHGGIAVAMLMTWVRQMDGGRWWPALGRAEVVETTIYQDGEFGEAKGLGESANSLEGLRPFEGRHGPQNQAPLSRDPIGNGLLSG